MEKIYRLNKQIKELELQRKQPGFVQQDSLAITKLQAEIEKCIDNRGVHLSTKEYRGLMQEMLKNLY